VQESMQVQTITCFTGPAFYLPCIADGGYLPTFSVRCYCVFCWAWCPQSKLFIAYCHTLWYHSRHSCI